MLNCDATAAAATAARADEAVDDNIYLLLDGLLSDISGVVDNNNNGSSG